MVIIDNKKLSIRYFLNDRLKPTVEEGELRYPVYAQISYDRKNIQFRVNWRILGGYNPYVEKRPFNIYDNFSVDDFEVILDKYEKYKIRKPDFSTSKIVDKYEGPASKLVDLDKIIYKAVKFDLGLSKGSIKFKGFRERLDLYSSPLLEIIDVRLNHKIIVFLSEIEHYQGLEFDQILDSDYFYENFEKLLKLDILEKLNDDLLAEIELYFLVGSFKDSDSIKEDYALNWLENELNEKLEFFYNKAFVSAKGIQVENFFYRYVLLYPPNRPISTYLKLIQEIVEGYLK